MFMHLKYNNILKCFYLSVSRMNGTQFSETLKQLGYTRSDELTDTTFDWIFENTALVPFLNWFCTNISQRNIVDPDALKE